MDFDYAYYLDTYEDLRHLNEEEAYNHWITHGIHEGRKCCKKKSAKIMDFDYAYYLDTYEDLRNLNEEEAYNHWITHGIHEGRKCYGEPINHETNITISIHLFNEYMFDEFLKYINKIKQVFSLVNVIISINISSNFDLFINQNYPDFKILKVENKGVDNLPFIICVKYIRENNIKTDFFLKLHTKESSNPAEDLLNWRKELIEPITDINNLYIINNYFKKIDNLGYIAAQKCVLPKDYDLDFPQNIVGLNAICQKYTHLEQNWVDFVGGNIFWISNNVLDQYLTQEFIDYLLPQFSYGKPPCNLTDKNIYIDYLCERLFTGVFCYDKTNIFVNEFKGTKRGISKTDGKVDNTYFYQPSVFSLHTRGT